MFEKEAEEYSVGKAHEHYNYLFEEHAGSPVDFARWCFQDGAEFGYNLAKEEIDYLNKHWGNEKDKANEWHYVKDGELPRQDGNTCFSIEVLANNKKWVYYRFDFGKWFCGNKEVKVIAWKEIVLPELPKETE